MKKELEKGEVDIELTTDAGPLGWGALWKVRSQRIKSRSMLHSRHEEEFERERNEGVSEDSERKRKRIETEASSLDDRQCCHCKVHSESAWEV